MPRQANPNEPKSLSDLCSDGKITQFGWTYIQRLSKVVAIRYYKMYDTEDLISLSITDLADFLLILTRSEEPPRSIRNVLFTRARNTMSNYLYHRKKDVPTEDEILDINAAEEEVICDIKYEYNTREEARLLSLELWRYYVGARETLKTCESL